MFFGCLTIAINGFAMVFDVATIANNGFRWFRTIGQTMRWFRWIVVVYCPPWLGLDLRRFVSNCRLYELIPKHGSQQRIHEHWPGTSLKIISLQYPDTKMVSHNKIFP